MSMTRNQRKRDNNFFEKIVWVLLLMFLLLLVRNTLQECKHNNYLQQQRHGSIIVGYKDGFLPDDFDPEAYKDALRRYDEEHGAQILSAQKETAPELADSRAEDAKRAS